MDKKEKEKEKSLQIILDTIEAISSLKTLC